MSDLIIHPARQLKGRVRVPGDKSISHRALLFNSLAEGTSRIEGFLPSGDCQATLGCLRMLGVKVETLNPTTLLVHGRGLRGFKPPTQALDCMRSGTTMRLLAGILAAQNFESVLSGDPQLLRRPMRRVTEPLTQMGAVIETANGYAPLRIFGRPLRAIEYRLPIASAQVKSALLLAGLYAEGTTIIHQPGPARDHSERILIAMGAPLTVNGFTATVLQAEALAPLSLTIPGDLSSAAFPIAAAALVPQSEVTIEQVGINPTRTGLLDVLTTMGAALSISEEPAQGCEPVGSVTITTAPLVGTTVEGDTVVRMIDEFPVLAVAATQAAGRTLVRDAAELRVKETDRIATVVTELRRLGAHIEALEDGFVVEGPTPLSGGVVDSHGDHRLAMALAVAGLIATDTVTVRDADCVADSFPGFVPLMRQLGAEMNWA